MTNETFRLVRLARLLVAALETFIPEAIPRLRELHASIVTDEPADPDAPGTRLAELPDPGWAGDLERDKTLLGKLADKAVAHGKLRDDDEEKGVQATAARDDDAESMRGAFRTLASDMADNHGRDALRIFGLDEAPSRNPEKLAVQVKTAHDRLLDETIPTPPVTTGGTAIERDKAAQKLATRLAVLNTSIGTRDKAKKVAARSGVRNRTTNKLLKRVYIYVGRRSEESFRMVGLDELANRLREVRRARPTEGEETPNGTADNGAPDTDASANAAETSDNAAAGSSDDATSGDATVTDTDAELPAPA